MNLSYHYNEQILDFKNNILFYMCFYAIFYVLGTTFALCTNTSGSIRSKFKKKKYVCRKTSKFIARTWKRIYTTIA